MEKQKHMNHHEDQTLFNQGSIQLILNNPIQTEPNFPDYHTAKFDKPKCGIRIDEFQLNDNKKT